MEKKPLISVVVPNYNHAKFLERRLVSVLNQTYQHLELIILDDLSSDQSRDVIENFRYHPKVARIEYNGKNSGSTFAQWEKGVALAKGEFIWIAESDDMADPYFLEKTLAAAKHNGAELVYTDSYQVDENDNRTGRWSGLMEKFGELNIWKKSFTKPGRDILAEMHPITNTIPNASCVLFKKSVVQPEFFELIRGFKYAGDWIFWGLCFGNCTVSYINEPLNFFRAHSNTTRAPGAVKKRDLYEYYYSILMFRPYLARNSQELFEESLESLFRKWHFDSPLYFINNFSRERYKIAKRVDHHLDQKIFKFLLMAPVLTFKKMFQK